MAQTRNKNSTRLNSPTSTTTDIDTTTRLTAVFVVADDANANNCIVEEHTVFNGGVEEEKEEKQRQVGYCTKFPIDILQKEYKESFKELTWRHKQNYVNNITKDVLASCVDC